MLRKKFNCLSKFGVGVAAMAATTAGALADTPGVDFTSAAASIKSDMGAALTVGLPVFALAFGIVVIKGFFKKTTH